MPVTVAEPMLTLQAACSVNAATTLKCKGFCPEMPAEKEHFHFYSLFISLAEKCKTDI